MVNQQSQGQMAGQQAGGGQGQYPVDNNTYNLMQALVSKLEALEVYRKYEKDADERSRGVWGTLIQEDTRHAQELLRVLKDTLNAR